MLAIALLLACTQEPGALHPLDATPIEGASAEDEAMIRAEVARIVESMQVDTLRFEAIEVKGRTSEDHLGGYDADRSRIELPGGLVDGPTFQAALVHQVCHAIDVQLGDLSADRSGDLVDVYRDLVHTHTVKDREDQHSEGFAHMCSLGGGPLEALADPAERSSAATDVASWMIDVAMKPVEGPERVLWLADAPIDVDFPQFAVFEDGVLRVPDGNEDYRYVDMDGAEVDGPDPDASPETLPLSLAAFDERPFPGQALTSARSASGAAVVFAKPSGGSRNHVFVRSRDGGWVWAAPITNPFMLSRVDGELAFAMESAPGVFRVERLP